MTVQPQEHQQDLLREIHRTEPFDQWLFMAVLMLLSLGTVLVYSATINEDSLTLGDPTSHLRSHLMHVGLGLVLLLMGLFIPYRHWRAWVYPGLGAVICLLLMVIFFGTTAGNAKRWLTFPGFSIQPAELAKLSFVLFLSHSLAKKAERIQKFTVAFIPHLLVCGVLILLCLFQPDFGTCVILVLLMFAMLFVGGTRLAYISLFASVGSFLAFQAIAYNDMRLGRIMAFIDPWAHRTDRGYQMVNSLIAFGSGGFRGQSLGFGGQTVTGYLPEGHTDFILAVLGEQLGFLGVLLVSLLLGLILYRGVATALSARGDFGRFLAFGLTLLICLQGTINMLVAVALIPTKGLTLPFVSYGGSSIAVCCFAVGILLNISRDNRLGRASILFETASELHETSDEHEGGRTGEALTEVAT